ncbi:hypothetical protein K466DRAFT_345349 [Polyporus arcularius HHB13444]|uniref:Uncharacterized protein n=1 Tax=Polyporus arcularius HHB13444 TaxID=1314778 RepID=A0A5C3PP23_9APHY|nr:hypothetical protein K466DRAFT_345349 [Polyporus arcularius HHB13444]
MPSAQGRKRGRTDSAEAEEQPSEDQSVEDTGPDLVSQQHGYGTRRSNQAARPGVAAGLAKRYKADIQAEANKKKDVEAAKKSKQEKQRAVKAAREQDSAKTVAAMQDRRAREEIEEIAFMDRTPPPVDDDLDDVPARHAGKIADGHELPRAQRHSNAEVEPDPLNDESDSHSDFSSSEDESAPPQVQSTRSKHLLETL